MLLVVLSYLPATLGLLSVGAVTWLKNPKDKINIYFGLFSIATGAWLGCLFLADLLLDPNYSLWALRLGIATGTPISLFFLWFSQKFPVERRQASKYFYVLTAIPAVVFVLLSPTPFIIPAVELRNNSAQISNLGLLYTLNTVYLVGGIFAGFYLLLRKFKHLNSRQRSQIRIVILGFIFAIAVNLLTGFVFTIYDRGSNSSNLTGALALLVFTIFSSYAIIRHRMFDIRLAIVRTLGFLLTVGFVGGLYSILVLGIGIPLINEGEVSLFKNGSSLLLLTPPTLLIAFTFSSIQRYIAQSTRRIFYQDLYDLRQVLDSFSDSLISGNDIEKIMNLSLKVISDAIKPTHSYFVTFDDQGKSYKTIGHHSKVPESMSAIVGDIKSIKSNPVVRDEMTMEVPESLVKADVFLALRFGNKEQPTGVILFGPKQNGRAYTSQDIDLLRIGAKNLTVALENAKRNDQISHFADTLKDEVLKATSKLRSANRKLKVLDTMKDDFISMASHQLRTPATSVHEALQMLNHPNMPLSKEDKTRLMSLAEASSEHMVTVVADMLSISRIQAGRFTVSATPIKLVELVERVMRQTAVLAEQKNIKVIFENSDKEIVANIDTPKITEAVSNYIENAIKYSPENTQVLIKLFRNEGEIRFEVYDQGIGVPEEERKNLFGKFYRAGNARTLQPDGNGIGLFVVKQIAKGHGGDAYYQPQNPGSLFGFWLPEQSNTNKPSK